MNYNAYSYSISEKEKQVIARNLISATDSHISTQVLTELTNTLTRKFKLRLQGALPKAILRRVLASINWRYFPTGIKLRP